MIKIFVISCSIFLTFLRSDPIFLLHGFLGWGRDEIKDFHYWGGKFDLENWLKERKDPMTTINETIQNTSEVIKRLPEFPEIMDKANQALTYLASGQIPQNSNSYNALNTIKLEMTAC